MKPRTNYEAAKAVLRGEYGNGAERRARLTADGFDYDAVQSIVNALVAGREVEETETEEEYLTVEVDLTKYKGLILKLGGIKPNDT